jgi:hypothetical protein
MQRFSISGLWEHAGSTVLAAGLLVADPVLSYLSVVSLPAWGHAAVLAAAGLLAFYRGRAKVTPAP